MTSIDLAQRAYNHGFRIDPICRSLIDTDFYKLLMLQLIWAKHPTTNATFSLINRTKSVRLADDIDEKELRDQLDHARTLRFTNNELVWLAGNTFYGRKSMFSAEFIEFLRGFQLPEYDLTKVDGQFVLNFGGRWTETTMWEIPALAIINELRSRAAMRSMSRFDLEILYARAKSKLWDKIQRLRILATEGPLNIVDFGTRRRHSHLWQRWCVEALQEGLGAIFAGTSNVLLSQITGKDARGTNAHELPMVIAALANNDDDLSQAPYKVMSQWAEIYGSNLQIILPDAFGTTHFLQHAPSWVAKWTGARPDSKPPIEGATEFIDYWKANGEDPKTKLVILSDGMDIDTIETSVRALRDQTNISIGWGTNLTNDFVGCSADGVDGTLKAISLVCKVTSADSRPAVKLSDNPNKATGDAAEIARYRRVFGWDGTSAHEVTV